jgi:hypothetical protein
MCDECCVSLGSLIKLKFGFRDQLVDERWRMNSCIPFHLVYRFWLRQIVHIFVTQPNKAKSLSYFIAFYISADVKNGGAFTALF